MGGTAPDRRRHRRARRLIGLGAALAAHAVIFTALVLGVRLDPVPAPAPVIELQLLHPPIAAARMRQPPKIPAARHPAANSASTTARPASPAEPPVIALPRNPEPGKVPSDDAGAVQAALRTSVGCTHADLVKLTPAERERCQKLAHDRRQNTPTYALGPSDLAKRAALDHATRVSEAWRNYRNSYSTNDYPGLRTLIPALKPLFGDEPAPPSSGP
ncbi:MAG TPA: hypothetical protein VHY32_12045 [Caulobacteraceae bacterium]|jgi:hypothetical protein|nr:hypothetical protein [Caulobacteraceae bacterium]